MRVLRKQLGLTMKQLGNELGMAESTVSLYETGKRNPDVQTLIKFANYFNVTLDYLCGRTYDSFNRDIPEHEKELMLMFDQLNAEGQEKLIDYADDLVQSGKYIKIHSSFVGKEA